MNILYSGDKNIARGVVLSVISLLRHAQEPVHVYILTAGVKTEKFCCEPLPNSFGQLLERYMKSVNPEHSADLFDVTQLFHDQLPVANLNTRFTPCCMLRLYADLVEHLPDRLLYLDGDVLCRDNISELYDQQMQEYEIAGVLDYYGRWFFRRHPLKLDYVNSGVLLLNMKRIRESGLFAKCRERCASRKMFMPDQSALNKLAQGKMILPRRFNEQRKLQEDTVLQHFTTSFRFWPRFRMISVKPWQRERMHEVLCLYEYDELFKEYDQIFNQLKEDCHVYC